MDIEFFKAIEVCAECRIAIANDDFSGVSESEEIAIKDGIEFLCSDGALQLIVTDGERTNEFCIRNCECCDAGPGERFKAELWWNR